MGWEQVQTTFPGESGFFGSDEQKGRTVEEWGEWMKVDGGRVSEIGSINARRYCQKTYHVTRMADRVGSYLDELVSERAKRPLLH